MGMVALLAAGPAFAQVGTRDVIATDSGDSGWMLAAGLFLLLTALPGITLFLAGRIGEAAISRLTIAQALAGAMGVLCWAALGYSLVFSPGNGLLGGGSNLFLTNLAELRAGLSIAESLLVLFQMGFALLALLIVTGTVADRARLGWILGFAPFWLLIVYVPIAHWVWGGGWIGALGAYDFAGGLVLALPAGVSALVVATMVGWAPSSLQEAGRRPGLSLAGALLLLAAGLALAGGSALSASDAAATAILNMILSAAAALLLWVGIEQTREGAISVTGVAQGLVSGIAVILPGCGLVSSLGAILLGLVGAAACYGARRLVIRSRRADDRGSSFALFGVGGATGAILLAPFMSEAMGGIGFAEGNGVLRQIIAQAVAVGVIAIWAALGTAIVGYAVAMAVPMREGERTD